MARISQEVATKKLRATPFPARNVPGHLAPLQELMSFPGGKHDDACDALGLIGQMFTTLLVGERPKQKPKVPDSGYRPFANVTEMEQEPSVVKQIDDDAFLQSDGRVAPQSVFSM